MRNYNKTRAATSLVAFATLAMMGCATDSSPKGAMSLPPAITLPPANASPHRISRDTYIPNPGSSAVTVYPVGATGNIAPVHLIEGGKTGLNQPNDVGFDAAGNLYVANYNAPSVTVFAPGANGNVKPIRTIKGSNTQLDDPWGIAVDGSGDVYVANKYGHIAGSIVMFSAGASGNAKPTAVIAGSKTVLIRRTGQS